VEEGRLDVLAGFRYVYVDYSKKFHVGEFQISAVAIGISGVSTTNENYRVENPM